MKLKFVIDKQYDTDMVFNALSGADWQFRAKYMGFSRELLEGFQITPPNERKKYFEQKIIPNIDQTYQRVLPSMEKARLLYQKSWDEISNDFSYAVERSSLPWLYDDYTCVVTNYHPGISNWNGNVIGRWWKEDPLSQRRITAHELLIAHYFSNFRKLYPNSLNDNQIWELAEISALALTGLDEGIKRFLPWDKNDYYTEHNYPGIVELQLQLKDPFLERKNFKQYMETGIKLIRNAPLGEGLPIESR